MNESDFTIQDYGSYTAADHHVWSLLYARQMSNVQQVAATCWLNGLEVIGFESDRLPNFDAIDRHLAKLNGWSIQPIKGWLANDTYFQLLAEKRFPSTAWIRRLDQLEFIEEPDMFHDTFGHFPLLADERLMAVVSGLAAMSLVHIKDEATVKLLANFYWYTVEFGMVRENDKPKGYGAGVLSSPTEALHSVSNKAVYLPFDIRAMMLDNYKVEGVQDHYYILESMEQLYTCLPSVKTMLHELATNAH